MPSLIVNILLLLSNMKIQLILREGDSTDEYFVLPGHMGKFVWLSVTACKGIL